jgi:glycosyltransferase involved in cell wall biosynthesis
MTDRAGSRLVVWIVNQYAGSTVHGMEFRHHALGKELVRRGHRVVIISGSYSHLYTTPPRTSGRYTFEDLDGITYCWVKVPRYRAAMSIGRVVNMLAFAAGLYCLPVGRLPAPDAIIVSSPSLFPILPAERWARRWGARLVFEVRDLWPLSLEEVAGLSSRHPLVLLMGWFERRAYRVADSVVSVLPASLPHFVSKGMTASKFASIPNGVTADALLDPAAEAPDQIRAAMAGSSFSVGFVGTLGLANALDTLIGAARILKDEPIRVVLVGEGSERAALERASRDLPNVVLCRPVPKDQVPAVLRLFDVCYAGYRPRPIYRFGISPNKVFEYMAASRPIILSARAANDIVADAACGITVEPGDPAALAQAIRTLRALPSRERALLGRSGRAYVEREHGVPGLVDRYLQVLEDGR